MIKHSKKRKKNETGQSRVVVMQSGSSSVVKVLTCVCVFGACHLWNKKIMGSLILDPSWSSGLILAVASSPSGTSSVRPSDCELLRLMEQKGPECQTFTDSGSSLREQVKLWEMWALKAQLNSYTVSRCHLRHILCLLGQMETFVLFRSFSCISVW